LEATADKSYNVRQFDKPIYEVPRLDSIVQTKIRDGIYHCESPERLDLYLENFGKRSKNEINTILVCLNAAVGNRNEKCAPFFSGLGVNRVLKQPLIAISDPIISSLPLSLAWYAGSERSESLQLDLATFLDQIAEKYNAKLILFGGSGGGFAAMAMSSYLKSHTTLLVSNPQTSISQYVYGFVRDYIKLAFPRQRANLKGLDGRSQAERAKASYEILENCNILHDVTSLKIRDNVKILYLQNKSDSHVSGHAVPFIKNRQCEVVGANSIIAENAGFYFGSWGKGHVGPSSNIITALLRKVIDEQSLSSILEDLENGLDGLNPNEGRLTYLNREQYRLFPSISLSGNKVRARCLIKRNGVLFVDDDLDYAFYLMDGNKRIANRYYTKTNSHIFELPNEYERVSVRCFVKDKFNQIIAADSAKVES
jgi:MinD-like ATPase involved in chromosome partitioning or flagellar assembly